MCRDEPRLIIASRPRGTYFTGRDLALEKRKKKKKGKKREKRGEGKRKGRERKRKD